MKDGDTAMLVVSDGTNKSLIWIKITDDVTMDHHHTQQLNYSPCGSYIDKGFCQVKRNPKIREKLGSGWVGQAPTRICLFFENLVFFCVVFLLYMFSKKIKNEGVGGQCPTNLSFFGFLDFFN